MTLSAEDERAKVCYDQNFLHVRSLNDQMNRVPHLAMVLTGGLWFGAGLKEDVDIEVKFVLLLLAGIANLAFILIVYRIRDVMTDYFKKIKLFDERYYVKGTSTKVRLGNYGMITVYAVLMFLAALISFLGAVAVYWPFQNLPRCLGYLGLFVLIVLIPILAHKRNSSPKPTSESAE